MPLLRLRRPLQRPPRCPVPGAGVAAAGPCGRLAGAVLAWALLGCGAPVAASEAHLRIVGGLAAVNQYTRHEEPFWTQALPRLSGGRASAEIVPFDRTGIRGQEMLRLVQLGAVPFGTVLLNLGAAEVPELAAVDLAGLNPDIGSLRRTVAAFRPTLQALLRERYGSELLALYTYPAQVTYCREPLSGLSALAGRRVRVSSAAQADWARALGASPVQMPFSEIVANVRAGNIDCAITGTMSGNTIGLHEVTTSLHPLPVTWGVAAFVANGAAWRALPSGLQELLQRELPKLEQAIWDESARETATGIACNAGAAACTGGRKGAMTVVPAGMTAADAARQREIFVQHVLPRWLQRCGESCLKAWNETIGRSSGIVAPRP